MKLRALHKDIRLWLTADETQVWAERPNAKWPCSVLAGKSLYVAYDYNGLYEYACGGDSEIEVPADELNACVVDHLLPELKKHNRPGKLFIKQLIHVGVFGPVTLEA